MNDFVDNSEDGHDILYADDDTSNVSDKDPEVLEVKLQAKATAASQWIQDNRMICSGEKTKQDMYSVLGIFAYKKYQTQDYHLTKYIFYSVLCIVKPFKKGLCSS